MKDKINYKLINMILGLIFISLLLGFLYYTSVLNLLLKIFVSLTPFYIGFFISWLLLPLAEMISKKFKINMKVANILVIFLSIFILLGVFLVIIPLAILQILKLADIFPQIWASFTDRMPDIFNYDRLKVYADALDIQKVDILNYVRSSLDSIGGLIDYLISGISSIVTVIAQIIIGYIIAIYFIGDIKKFTKRLLDINENRHPNRKKLILEMSVNLFSYLRGVLIISSFVFILMTIGVSLIGIDAPVLFGLISGITNIIPYVGPFIGGAPLFIVALAVGYKQAILAVILILIVQFIESNFLQPKIMSKSTNLHPVTIILGLVVFGNLFGLIGMIISTPTLSLVNVVIKNSKFKDKITI